MNLLEEIPYKIPIKSIFIEDGLIAEIDNLDFGHAHIICDENTEQFISSKLPKTVLPGNQKPMLSKADELSKIAADAFIAIGSGTINDLAKYASYIAKKPYIIFGTAPSMNGYASANASLIDGNYKKSYQAHAPISIYLDTEILKGAPKRLINAGIGDSICRLTCQNDNLLASIATGSTYHEEFFNFMCKYEDAIFEDISALIKTLIFSGIAMLLAGNSSPASQGEHMLAHYMELMQTNFKYNFHGEEIAVTTISMAKIQQQILQNEILISEKVIDEDLMFRYFGNELAPYFIEQLKTKYAKIKSQKISPEYFEIPNPDDIENKLKQIGAPTKPEDIGWDPNIYSAAINQAALTRDRFTFLDLA